MEEKKENLENNGQREEVHGVDYYIDAIKELKANTVDRAKYEEKCEENRKLVKSLVDGEQLERDNGLPKKSTAKELREELYGPKSDTLSNLDYWSKTLELRDIMIEDGYEDPFLPLGHKIVPTVDDVAAVDRVVKGVQECIDYAKGDSQIFTDELQRIMVDTAPMVRTRKK